MTNVARLAEDRTVHPEEEDDGRRTRHGRGHGRTCDSGVRRASWRSRSGRADPRRLRRLGRLVSVARRRSQSRCTRRPRAAPRCPLQVGDRIMVKLDENPTHRLSVAFEARSRPEARERTRSSGPATRHRRRRRSSAPGACAPGSSRSTKPGALTLTGAYVRPWESASQSAAALRPDDRRRSSRAAGGRRSRCHRRRPADTLRRGQRLAR